MKSPHSDIEERARLAGNNKFELLLFRLGESTGTGRRELFGINVFKVREVLVMPPITQLANSHENLMGVANIRGQIIPVINLPAVVGCQPSKGMNILMVTEYGRTVQGFAVEDVNEIVRMDWDQVLPAQDSHAGAMITGIARIDGADPNTRLAQVLGAGVRIVDASGAVALALNWALDKGIDLDERLLSISMFSPGARILSGRAVCRRFFLGRFRNRVIQLLLFYG